MTNSNLLFSIRNQIYKDSTSERILMFERLIDNKGWLKTSFQVLEVKRLRQFTVLLSLLYGFFSHFRFDNKNSKKYFIGHRNNERKIFENYKMTILKGYSFVETTSDTQIAFPVLKNGLRLFRYYKFLSNLSKREKKIFVLMRVSRLLFYYSSLLDVFHNDNLQLAFSTDGNPYGNAVMAFQNCENVKTLFLAHAADSIQPLRVRVDTAYFYGQHSLTHAVQNQSQIKEVRFFNFACPKFEVLKPGRVGIFLAKDFIESAVKNLVQALLDEGYSSILIRLHPDSIHKFNAEFADRRIHISKKDSSVEQDLARCQLIIGGNSTVLLESLLQGVFGFYDRSLDAYTECLLPTISNGVVQTFNGVSSLKSEKSRQFYLSSKWQNQMASVYNFTDSLEKKAEAELNHA